MTAKRGRDISAFTEDSLIDIFEVALSGRVIRSRDGHNNHSFDAILRSEVKLLSRRLTNGTHRFSAYQEKLVLKGANSFPRQISIPSTRDRIALKALQNVLSVPFADCKPEIAQRKIRRLRTSLRNNSYDSYVRVDIKNFFPSIPHRVINEALAQDPTLSRQVVDLVMSAISAPTLPKNSADLGVKNFHGVPQGLAISNLLAEICMREVDKALRGLPDIQYERYVDDILILCSSQRVESAKVECLDALRGVGLTAHSFEDKASKSVTGPVDVAFDYLGYEISARQGIDPLIVARRSSVLSFERRLAKVFTQFHYNKNRNSKAMKVLEWRLSLIITGCIFDGTRRGWLHYFSEMTSAAQAQRLDGVIRRLSDQFMVTELNVPSFRKMYWHIRETQGAGSLIENYDEIEVEKARKLLVDVFGVTRSRISSLTDEEVLTLFRARMRKEVAELETDVGPIS